MTPANPIDWAEGRTKRFNKAVECLRRELDSGRVSGTVYLSKAHARAILKVLDSAEAEFRRVVADAERMRFLQETCSEVWCNFNSPDDWTCVLRGPEAEELGAFHGGHLRAAIDAAIDALADQADKGK